MHMKYALMKKVFHCCLLVPDPITACFRQRLLYFLLENFILYFLNYFKQSRQESFTTQSDICISLLELQIIVFQSQESL